MASKAIRLPSKLKELRIHLCQVSDRSKGVRSFIEKHYIPIKKQNPTVPILIRECGGVQPILWLRYEHGKETRIPLDNLEADEVLKRFEKLPC